MRISDWSSDVCSSDLCIFDVAGRNGDAALALFGRLVDVVERNGGAAALFGEHLGDRGGQRGLAMVDVTDGADVAVRLRPLKFSLGHDMEPSCSCVWVDQFGRAC